MIPSSERAVLIVDASVMVAVCTRETGRLERAAAMLVDHARLGGSFFAPGVLFAEVLFALCDDLGAGGHVLVPVRGAAGGQEAHPDGADHRESERSNVAHWSSPFF